MKHLRSSFLFFLFVSCVKIDSPSYYEELNNSEWQSLYHYTCQQQSIEKNASLTFSHVEGKQIKCKPIGGKDVNSD